MESLNTVRVSGEQGASSSAWNDCVSASMISSACVRQVPAEREMSVSRAVVCVRGLYFEQVTHFVLDVCMFCFFICVETNFVDFEEFCG